METKSTIRVHKFHRINENLLQLFSLNAFYCCSFDQLNDPLEAKIELNEEFLNNLFHIRNEWQINYPHYNLWSEFIHQIGKDVDQEPYFLLDRHKVRLHVEDLHNIPEKEKSNIILSSDKLKDYFTRILMKEYNYRVISFSMFTQKEKENEKLMWAFYSGEYKGVKLTFDFPTPMETNFAEFQPIIFEPVIYGTELPILKTEEDFLKCLRFKYDIWKFECEHRVLIRNYKGIGFTPEYLKEITFGLNVPLPMIISLVRLCSKLDYTCGFNQAKYVKGKLIDDPITPETIKTYIEMKDTSAFRIEI
jgi:hypothetical protein